MAMQSERLVIVGGNDDFSNDVAKNFLHPVDQVSRRNGLNMDTEDGQRRIVKGCRKYKWVLLHGCGSGFAQTELLYKIFDAWLEEALEGHIFVTGSYVTYQPNDKMSHYLLVKKSLDTAVQQCSKLLETQSHTFRVTNLKCGMLDSQKSRQKSHWEGHGVSGQQLAQVMASVLQMPKDLQIPEVVVASTPSLIDS